jgi:hypothetical protein
MTAPAADKVGAAVSYPVFFLESAWTDGAGNHQVNFQVMLSPGGVTPASGSVEDAQAFLEAMAAWAAGTYQPGQAGFSSGTAILASIDQSESTLFTS